MSTRGGKRPGAGAKKKTIVVLNGMFSFRAQHNLIKKARERIGRKKLQEMARVWLTQIAEDTD